MDDVSYTYRGSRRALDNVSTHLDSRRIILLGPNGAGKTTLLRLVTTQFPMQEGSVEIAGWRLGARRVPPGYRERLGVLPQGLRIFPGLTCLEFLHYVAWLRRVPRSESDAKVGAALDRVDLSARANDRVKSLSGGMRQRLALAQAIVAQPDVLILDEPTVGLDPQQRASFRDLVNSLSDDCLILLSTHLIEDAAALAEELLILDRGRVAFAGKVTDLCGIREAATGAVLEQAYLRLMSDEER